jgi:uncharacterized protein YkwD
VLATSTIDGVVIVDGADRAAFVAARRVKRGEWLMTSPGGVLRGVQLRTALACLLALAVVGASFSAAMSAPRSDSRAVAPLTTSASAYCPDAEERAFLTLINDYRRQNGLSALTLVRALGGAAEHHSVDMATYNYFSHTLKNGTSWSQNLKDHGYSYNTYRGENIAAGNSAAQATFNQWKNSSAHRANMLSKNFKAIGIGRAYKSTSTYKWYWTTTFGGYVSTGVSC